MAELRYAFGKNWDEFISRNLNAKTIEDSMEHLSRFLRRETLAGKTFVDLGCGSGLHSLAALRLGARNAVSIDYDLDSVATTRKVREWAGAPANWSVSQGSVLDDAFMASLPPADIVYSWGVLHHTGDMWKAVRNAAIPLKEDGEFYISLYSSDMYVDPTPEYWITLKRAYNQASPLNRAVMEMKFVHWQVMAPEIAAGRDPLARAQGYGRRGMTMWTDAKDWLGGFPMEFAGFTQTRDFCAGELGLDLVNVLSGEGCTEYLFVRPGRNAHWDSIEKSRATDTLTGPFEHLGGHGYRTALSTALAACADDESEHMRSPLMLYEDGRPLGLAHHLPHFVLAHGMGRFAHRDQALTFSTSDNSDPNSNGRRYALCTKY